MTPDDPNDAPWIPSTDRRSLITAFGAAGAAALIGGIAPASHAGAAAAPAPAGTPPRIDVPPPTVAGRDYLTFPGYGLHPGDTPSADGYASTTGEIVATAGAAVVAPVHLPDGTDITDVLVFGKKFGSFDMQSRLVRHTLDPDGTLAEDIATFETSSTPAGTFTGTMSVNTAKSVVDNSRYAYSILVYLPANPDTRLRGIRIGYTRPSPFVPIDPVRAFDSRAALPSPGLFGPNTSRVISVKDARDVAGHVDVLDVVPVGASAVAVNVTVTGPNGPNFVAVLPGDASGYTTSTVNFGGSADVANGAIVKLDGNRQLKIFMGDQPGSAHVIVDVTAYFR